MPLVISASNRLVAALMGMILATSLAMAQGAPPAVPVTVVQPIAKRVTLWDEYSGRFRAIESVEVRARVSGFIDKVEFKDGQMVKAGDLLFTLDKRPFENAVAVATAELARSKAQVALGETEVERAAPLVKSGAVTQRDFDQRTANLNVALANQQAAEASLKNAELNLDWAEVRAPVSGRISDKKVDAGNLVVGGQQGATLLTTIVTVNPIQFEFDVSEADFLRYSRLFLSGSLPSSRSVETPVRIQLADEKGWSRTGRVDFMDNQLNPRSGTMRIRALVENDDHLLQPGLFARLQLFGGEIDALLIPDAAIVSDQARKIVFTVGPDNIVKANPVHLGALDDGLRIITDGLHREDRVIIDGLANPMVRPGAKVVPQAQQVKSSSN